MQGQEHPILILDSDEGITADPNVRLALNLAVDKQAIVDQVFGGFAAVDAGQLLSPSVLGFNDSIDAYPYDADKAKQLIKDAGVAGQTIQLVGEAGPLVERPRPPRGGRRLLESSRARSEARHPRVRRLPRRAVRSRRAGPTRSTCRAPTTSSILIVSSPRTTRRVESARRTPMQSCRRSSTRVGQQLDPSDRAADLQEGRQDRLRRRVLRVVGQQPGPLRLVRAADLDTAGRLEAPRQGNVRLRLSW